MVITEAELKVTRLILSTMPNAKAATISAWFLVYDGAHEPSAESGFTAEEYRDHCEREWNHFAAPIVFG